MSELDSSGFDSGTRGTGAVPAQGRTPVAVSRRTLVKTAVGAGVAIAVAGSVGIAHAGPGEVTPGSVSPLGGAALNDGTAAAMTGPVVAHVVNAHTGALEVFSAGIRTQVQDADLAARIGRTAAGQPTVVHVVNAHAGHLEVFGNGTRTQVHNRDLAARIVRAA